MKSLTQTTMLGLMTLLLSPLAQAFVGSSPELNCRDISMGIPEQKIVVQVFGKSEANPYVHVRVQRQDLNLGSAILFEGNVSEINEVRAKTYSGYGLAMKLAETPEGGVGGIVALQNADGSAHSFNVDCQVFYNLMNQKPAPPTDQL